MTVLGIEEPKFLTNDNDELLGVALGRDFATEHEMGIAALRKSFGAPIMRNHYRAMSDYEIWHRAQKKRGWLTRALLGDARVPPMGLEKRRVRRVPEGLTWVKAENKREGFGFNGYRGYQAPEGWHPSRVEQYSKYREEWDLIGAWSEESFIVMASSSESIEKLRVLYEKVREKTAMFSLPTKNLNGIGLMVVDIKAFSREQAAEYYDIDKEKFDSEKALDETGIEAYLRENGKSWFALGNYKSFHGEEPTVWLNPKDNGVHGKNNSGSYTIDELKAWAHDRGPVMRVQND